jgi:hypothetical protein
VLVCVHGVRGQVDWPGDNSKYSTVLHTEYIVFDHRARRGAELRCVDAIGRHATKIGVANILGFLLRIALPL